MNGRGNAIIIEALGVAKDGRLAPKERRDAGAVLFDLFAELDALLIPQAGERVIVGLRGELDHARLRQTLKYGDQLRFVALRLIEKCARKSIGHAKWLGLILELLD